LIDQHHFSGNNCQSSLHRLFLSLGYNKYKSATTELADVTYPPVAYVSGKQGVAATARELPVFLSQLLSTQLLQYYRKWLKKALIPSQGQKGIVQLMQVA
jgi:hypothetical protein